MRRCAMCRSISHRVSIAHSGAQGPQLASALELQWRHGFPTMPRGMGSSYTSGFHPLLAGMNPAVARGLLAVLQLSKGKRLLDPFVGSGTVVVEGAAAGFEAWGVDVSPLATFVATHHAWTHGTPDDRARLIAAAQQVASYAASEANSVGKKAGSDAITRDGSDSLRDWGALARALHGLSSPTEHGGHGVTDEDLQRLWFCFSASVARGAGPKGAKGAKAKLMRGGTAVAASAFVAAVAEYCERAAHLSSAVSAAGGLATARPRVLLGDTRAVFSRAGVGDTPLLFDGLLTSPPYAGVYDYMAHAREHRERLTRHSGTGGAALAARATPAGEAASLADAGRAFLEVAVPGKGSREWGPHFDSRGEMGAHKAGKKLLRPKGTPTGIQTAAAPKTSLSGPRQGVFQDGGAALAAAWAMEEVAWIGCAGSVLRGGAMAALLVGDGVEGMDVDALSSARRSALETGMFEEVACATIRSTLTAPHETPGKAAGHGPPPGNRRPEHFLLLRRL